MNMSNVLEAHNKHQNKTTDAFLFSLILDFLALKNIANFIGKPSCWIPFLMKSTDL